KGALHGAVVRPCAFDGDDQVAKVVIAHGRAQVADRGSKSSLLVLAMRGWNQDRAVEIAQQELGLGFATVDTNAATMLRPDRSDPLGQLPRRLLDQECACLLRTW